MTATCRLSLETADCQLSLLTHLHGAYSAASLAIGPMEPCVSVDAFKLRPHDTQGPRRRRRGGTGPSKSWLGPQI